MVLESGQAQLRKAGRSLAIEAKAGQILFPGDVLESGDKAVTLQYCPGESIYRLSPRSELRVGVRELNVLDGKLDSIRELPVCILPELPASVPATRRHNGASLVRDLLDDGQLPADLAGQPRGIGEVPAESFENEMAPVEAALRADPEDLPARIAKAVLLGRHGPAAAAVTEYRQLRDTFPDSTWVRERLFVHEERAAQRSLFQQRSKTALEGQGQTFALLIGISQYQDPRIEDLQFAHTDALLFEKHLKSPRGGALPDENIRLLVNEEANTSAVRNAFDSFLKARAGPNDIVLVFLAAHGTVDRKTGQGYIVTYDSNPEDLASTAVLMSDIQNLIQEELTDIRRLLIYVDVCHAGMIGTIDTHRNRIHRHVANLAEADGEVGGMMASRPGEVSFEGPQYGGGHGAFSYFLLNALNGAADYDQDQIVSVDDVIDYVRNHVEEGTFNRQHPRDIGDLPNDLPMARLEDEGIEVQPWRKPQPGKRRQTMTQLGERTRGFVAPAVPPRSRRRDDLTSDQQRFDEALEQGRILPSDPDNAFSSLNDLRRRLKKADYLGEANRLRVALEIEGQQVLLRYLEGDQVGQNRSDFVAGAAYLEAAKLLTPESLLLDARSAFCLGRAAIFEQRYDQAVELLEKAVRLDPVGAYSYNALGIAYLEQGEFERAIAAFRDAANIAKRWAYPLHNLALVHAQIGDYQGAIDSYREAIERAPEFAYLPYNLGLIYQKMGIRLTQVTPISCGFGIFLGSVTG